MSARPAELAALAQFSAEVGANVDLVQGGGGNSSLEADGRLWIKASGMWLAQASEREIFMAVDLARLRANIAADEAEPTDGAYDATGGLRPSIETTLHALMSAPVVLHTHSVNAIAWATRRDGADALAPLLEGIDWLWVEYERPGLPLTRAVRQGLEMRPRARVLVLRNHGLVVSGDTVEETRRLNAEVERRLAIPPRAAPPTDLARLKFKVARDGWRLPGDPLVHAIASEAGALRIARLGPLYPDHVVFLDGALPVLERTDDLAGLVARHRRDWGRPPAYAALPGAGVLVAADISPGAEEMLRCLARVVLRIAPEWPIEALSPPAVAALVNWEAEHFRRALDKPRAD